MQETGMHRIGRVLAALKMMEMAQLGALQSAAEAARKQARDLRHQSRALIAQDAPGDMGALGHWQRHSETRARDAEAKAARLDEEAEPLKLTLARTLGRESVVRGLIEKADRENRCLIERRSEDAVPTPRRA